MKNGTAMPFMPNRLKLMCQRERLSRKAAVRPTLWPKSSRPRRKTPGIVNRPSEADASRTARMFDPSAPIQAAW